MSSAQNAPSPRGPRVKHQHSRSATQAHPSNYGNAPQGRSKGNRKRNANNANAQHQGSGAESSPGRGSTSAQDLAFADSAVLSSEDVHIPTGPRNAKKHTQSQPSSDRVFSPTSIPPAALTDSELAPHNHSATPMKVPGAYAGPTFHASPAPSALPMPRFLSRSVPAKTIPLSGPPTPPEDNSDEPPSPTPSPPSPSRAPIPVPARHEDSPLDVLFNAHRAEKSRNVNPSPASGASLSSPHHAPGHGQIHHSKQDSYGPPNTMFPIELDSAGPTFHRPSATVSSSVHRSITAPSRIPQVQDAPASTSGPETVQNLLSRLSQSKNKSEVATTPPRTVDRLPSEPSSRHQTPSPFYDPHAPFRSASGPTTPAPMPQDPSSDFHYGNRNLSPLFKAAKADSPKRNSGLRTEITADSPIVSQGGFPPTHGTNSTDPNTVSRNYLNHTNNVFTGPSLSRRGSAPHVHQHREQPNHHKARTPKRNSHQQHPNTYPASAPRTNGNSHGASTPTKPNLFMPASVSAKKFSSPTRTTTADSPPNPLSQEQILKTLLKMNLTGDAAGVQQVLEPASTSM